MRTAILGTETKRELDLQSYIPPNTTCIISGGEDGVEKLAERWADDHGYPKLILSRELMQGWENSVQAIVGVADQVVVLYEQDTERVRAVLDCARQKQKPLWKHRLTSQKSGS